MNKTQYSIFEEEVLIIQNKQLIEKINKIIK